MNSQKSIWKRIANWFADNTWIYGTAITVVLCAILAIVSINTGLETTGAENIFIGGPEFEWSFEENEESSEEESSEDSSYEALESSEEASSEEESSSDNKLCSHRWQCIENTLATCYEDGAITHQCIDCMAIKTTVRPAGHTYVDGRCSRCGAIE